MAGESLLGVVGSDAMVPTGHPLAAQAAQAQLLAGGSAVDAAIAADAVLGVVEPMATGVGGDLLAMLVPSGQAPISYNGTGRAPLGLTAAMVEALPSSLGLVAWTSTPGSGLPWSSVIFPSNLPVGGPCARASTLTRTNTKIKLKTLTFLILSYNSFFP